MSCSACHGALSLLISQTSSSRCVLICLVVLDAPCFRHLEVNSLVDVRVAEQSSVEDAPNMRLTFELGTHVYALKFGDNGQFKCVLPAIQPLTMGVRAHATGKSKADTGSWDLGI